MKREGSGEQAGASSRSDRCSMTATTTAQPTMIYSVQVMVSLSSSPSPAARQDHDEKAWEPLSPLASEGTKQALGRHQKFVRVTSPLQKGGITQQPVRWGPNSQATEVGKPVGTFMTVDGRRASGSTPASKYEEERRRKEQEAGSARIVLISPMALVLACCMPA